MANYYNSSTASYTTDSKIYKWNGYTFSPHQDIPTTGAVDWKYFTIDGDHYLVVANCYTGSSHTANSIIYKWDTVSELFIAYEDPIVTHGAQDWEYFSIDDAHYLVVANYINGSYDINSVIYKWNGVAFEPHQSILTHGAHDWEYFTIGEDPYIAVANRYHGTEGYNTNSYIYKWNSDNEEFDLSEHIRSIQTNGATDWEFFTINGESYLAVANSYSGSTHNIKSRIYKWDDYENEFNPIPPVDTQGAYDWEYLSIADNHYLVVANYHNDASTIIDSVLYKWDQDGDSFAVDQTIPTVGALDWEYFTIGTEHFLAVANYHDDTTHDVNSVVYKISF